MIYHLSRQLQVRKRVKEDWENVWYIVNVWQHWARFTSFILQAGHLLGGFLFLLVMYVSFTNAGT